MGAAAVALLAAAVVGVFVVNGDGDDDVPSVTEEALPFELEAANVYAYQTRYRSMEPLQVAVGDKLTFDNRDDKPHTFTSDEGLFDSDDVAPDSRYAYAYAAPGTYRFHCEIHPTMRGSVMVVPK